MVNLPLEKKKDTTPSQTTSLPTRLRDWKLSTDEAKFAYGGDEVDLSVWDTELAFQVSVEKGNSLEAKKRKRNDALLPAEVWRAKNVPNDGLGLRQPIRITSLTFLDNATHLLAGTAFGDVRHYDTRAGRRPIAQFKAPGRAAGLKVVTRGSNDKLSLSISSASLGLNSIQTGRTVYGYKGDSLARIIPGIGSSGSVAGLSGCVNSIATTPTLLATTALDRFARIHSVQPPTEGIRHQQDQKGQVLEKVFTKGVPTVVIWDNDIPITTGNAAIDDDDDDEIIWRNMQHVEDDSDTETNIRNKHRRRQP
ncbi:hypothetical protein AX17_003450 [Amanita inopinata Kibby_2008]|nr:hypothetical protein AX17_003450 [Amanita inopinata Kibby_2008]